MPRSVQRLVHVALPWLFWVFGACAESHQVPEADPAIARAAAQASGRLGHAGLPGVVAAPLPPRTVFGAGVGFRSSQAQREHYEKHRREFGRITNAEYLARAQSLRDTTVGGPILEVRRDDGTISRFNRTDGSFVAFDTNGTLRTFFRPNDGETYFRRQAVRRSFR
jgi:hypothetical protein